MARRYGVKKLMPIAEARKLCPDLVLADGEDLSPFRDVSKRLYALLRSYSWNGRVERLGLDEMFLDATDIVSYNVELLNRNALPQSYFCLSRTDPEVGFEYDASAFAGCVCGEDDAQSDDHVLRMRLLVASHLARYLRLKIEEEGYTCACGIATNKLLAKLVGDKNKPQNQTTLLAVREHEVLSFMDEHSLRKIPGIGFRTTSILEAFVLNKPPDTDIFTTTCSTTAGQVRTHPSISPPTLERLLSGPGSEKSLGAKIWSLLHGVDDTDVKPARDVPTQISIEDTYKGLATPAEIRQQLFLLTASLLRRMRIDLSEPESARWLARPKTLRLTTRPYFAFSPDSSDPIPHYNSHRGSRSCPLPSFVFHPTLPQAEIAERLVAEALLPLFYKLHPPPPTPLLPLSPPLPDPRTTNMQGSGFNIGLLNVCVANMAGGAEGSSGGGGGGCGAGRDIGEMFRRQEGVLREFSVYDDGDGGGDVDLGKGDEQSPERAAQPGYLGETRSREGDDAMDLDDAQEEEEEGEWDHEDSVEEDAGGSRCPLCDRLIPRFAALAHERYHSLEDP